MSRCFPFPPPGYVKKAVTDDEDLLKKEKQKEKKHKKEKRDKEKRESKEKREKEGRDGKHKEKKDKKEKHREKKKDKDRDKDKDKSKDRDKCKTATADEKGLPRQVEGPNAGKLNQKDIKQDDKKDTLSENRVSKQYTENSNGEKAREKNHLAEENKDSKFLLELDRRIRNDDGGASNQSAHKFTNTDHRKDEGTVRLVSKSGGTWPDSNNEKLKDKGLDVKKIDGRGMHAEVRSIRNAPVQNHSGNLHPRVDGMPKVLGKYFEKNLETTIEGKVKEKKDEEKEKVKEKTGEGRVKEKKDEKKEKVKEKKDDKRRDKKKDKEKEKKGHGKDKDRDKEKKKEEKEKTKEHTAPKITEQNKLKESNTTGLVDSNSFPQFSKNNHENAVSGENLKKRKDIESNGVPRASDSLPNKFPRLSSSHSFTENGRLLEPCQIPTPDASDRPRVATDVKVENKERKINGIIDPQSIAASSNKTHTAPVPVDLVIETTSAKSPHPDTKYINQVYSVPKVKQWSEFGDDQEWLFSSNLLHERKSVAESSEVGETPQVWAEALHIESADVFALPYVIPY